MDLEVVVRWEEGYGGVEGGVGGYGVRDLVLYEALWLPPWLWWWWLGLIAAGRIGIARV